jgi:hypothetical protein
MINGLTGFSFTEISFAELSFAEIPSKLLIHLSKEMF